MQRRPTRSTRNDTLMPYTTLCRSDGLRPVKTRLRHAEGRVRRGRSTDLHTMSIMRSGGDAPTRGPLHAVVPGGGVHSTASSLPEESAMRLFLTALLGLALSACRRSPPVTGISEGPTTETPAIMTLSYAVICMQTKTIQH